MGEDNIVAPPEAQSSEKEKIEETAGDSKFGSNIWKLTSIISAILLLITSSTTIYFYSKYKNALSSKNEEMKTDETAPTPASTLQPTPTPIDYYFDDSSVKINYYPVKYNTYSKQQQKVAQTFTLDESKTVQAVVLKASFGVGNKIGLSIHKAGNVDDFTDGELIASGEYEAEKIIKENKFEIILDKPVQLDANVEYALVISVDDTTTQTSIAFSENDLFTNGKMYKYTRLIGGNGEIISNTHSWQPENSQDVLYLLKEM